ncbi:50S ribosomal protein L6 [Alphaproteobacteria bacterium]|nr:50S ribosomal protein L6 [Alphaproteobacteria bacterium]
MSRVGKHKISIPTGIVINFADNQLKFKKGSIEQQYDVPDCLECTLEKEFVSFVPKNTARLTRALWGTTRRNVFNVVAGLANGFKIELELVGVGYKAAVQNKDLVLQLGYSHDVVYPIPDGISIDCPKASTVVVTGHCKKQVGEVAARLRKFRKPEPYKGKGVIKNGEFVYRKEGKKK